MRRLIKIVVIFILIILVAIVSIPFVVPMDTLKNQAVAKIEALTGRKVSMGKVKLSVFPNIALSADDVSIGNPAWVKSAGNMAEVKTLRIGVELMPLLHKDIHVTDLKLESPSIHLIKNGTQANWQFTTDAPAPTEKKAAIEKTEHQKIAAPLRLDTLAISNGSLVMEDSVAGTKQALSDVNVKLNSKDLPKSVSFKGDAVYNGNKADIDLTLGSPMDIPLGAASNVDLKASYGSNSVKWKGTAALKGGIAAITGSLDIPEIDTTALGGKAAEGKEPVKAAAPASGERWSSAPISMEALSLANADLNITVGKLVLSKMTLSDVKAHVKLQNGALAVAMDEMPMFSGSAKLDITANHAGAAGIKAELKNIKTEELLTTLANSKVLTGTLSGNVDLNAHGNSQRALVSSLAGTGGFQMKDGTFKGGNLLSMTKNIATSFQAGQSKGETTDFSKLGGTFTANNGVFINNDLAMQGPLLSLNGTGQVDLPNWLVHYVLTPQLITNRGSDATATASATSVSGISVPVQVEGSLDAPSYHPDLRGALEQNLKDPAKLKESLKDLKGNLTKDNLKKNLNSDTLKGLLGR